MIKSTLKWIAVKEGNAVRYHNGGNSVTVKGVQTLFRTKSFNIFKSVTTKVTSEEFEFLNEQPGFKEKLDKGYYKVMDRNPIGSLEDTEMLEGMQRDDSWLMTPSDFEPNKQPIFTGA